MREREFFDENVRESHGLRIRNPETEVAGES